MPHPTPALLAIDGGQTGSKVRLRWDDGTRSDDVLAGVLTDRPLPPQLAAVIGSVTRTSGSAPHTVAIGVSGVTDVVAAAAELFDAPELADVQRLLVTHDSVSSFLGVLGDRQGAVIAVGTGVVTLGVGPRAAARVDGWGNIMGDAGSGYWIGREALDAVMRAYDGRGDATALTEVVRGRWPDLEAAYIDLQASDERIREVASFAEPTARLAAEGDAVCIRICLGAADQLAISALAALRTTDAPADAVIGATGGVLRSALVREAFEREVLAERPHARFVPPVGSGLDGAAILADLGPEHPLHGRIAEFVRPQPGLAPQPVPATASVPASTIQETR